MTALTSAIALAASVTSNHSAPYLPVVGLHPGPRLTVTGVAPDIRVATDVDPIAGIDRPCWVDAKGLAEVLSRLGETATMRLAKDRLEVSAGRSVVRIPVHTSGLAFGAAPTGEPYEVSTADLATAIGRVVAAAGVDPARPQINGVLLSGDRVAATDGHRLHVSPAIVPAMQMVVPMPMVQAILRAIGAADVSTATLTASDAELLFSIGDTRIRAPLCMAPFPPYAAMLPALTDARAYASTCRVSARLVLDAIKVARTAARFAEGGTKGAEPPLVISASRGDLIVASADRAAEAACPCEGTFGPVSTSASYFEAAVSSMGGDDIEMMSGGELDPVEIRRGSGDTVERRIVMPRRM